MAHHKFPPLKNYELIEHTADIGIRVKGKDLNDLFKNSASAMFDIIAEKKESPVIKQTKMEPTWAISFRGSYGRNTQAATTHPHSKGSRSLRARKDFTKKKLRVLNFRPRSIKIEQKADNLEELLVNWLNELLSLSATKELIFSKFRINKIDKNTLQAVVIGEDIKNYRVNTEVKAATYHELRIGQVEGGWQAEVIFDV